MDMAGDHFLAGPGRAVDQHGDVACRHPFGERAQREAPRIGGGGRIAAEQRGGEMMGEIPILGAIAEPRRRTVTRRDENAPGPRHQHQRRARGGRGLTLGDHETVAGTRPVARIRPHVPAQPLQPGQELRVLPHRLVGVEDGSHRLGPLVRGPVSKNEVKQSLTLIFVLRVRVEAFWRGRAGRREKSAKARTTCAVFWGGCSGFAVVPATMKRGRTTDGDRT